MQVLVRFRWNTGSGLIEPFQPKGWRHHPVVLMWQGHEAALVDYQDAVCTEWTARGYRDTCQFKTAGLLRAALADGLPTPTTPPWLGDEPLHRSHQSNLIRKDAEIYASTFPGVPADLPYVWPVEAVAASRHATSPAPREARRVG